MTYPSLEAFDLECEAFSTAIAALKEQASGRPSNCPPWTLHELVVHTIWSIGVPAQFQTGSGGPVRSAADYYRRPERDTAAYRTGNVERTRSVARDISVSQVPDLFRRRWRLASATFASYHPEDAIVVGGLLMTTESYLLTRLISVAAHGVDVAITTGSAAWTTREALKVVRPVLVDLLGADPPPSWSDQELLELGTGRVALRAGDEEALGHLRSRFPLLA